jgi:hypothetical protein
MTGNRRFGLLATLVFAVSFAGGCAEPSDSSEQISVSRDNGMIVLTSSAQGRADVNRRFIPTGTPPAIHASSFSWPARGMADLYLYGLAPAGAATFETQPPGSAKIQSDGTFLAVIPNQADAHLQSIPWRFLAADGTVLAEGDGPNT